MGQKHQGPPWDQPTITHLSTPPLKLCPHLLAWAWVGSELRGWWTAVIQFPKVVIKLRKGAQGPGGSRSSGAEGVGSVGDWGRQGRMGLRQGSHVRCTDSVILGPPWRPCPRLVWSGWGSTAEQWHSPGFGVRTGFEFQLPCRKVTPPPSTFPLLSKSHAACSVLWKAQGPVQADYPAGGSHLPTFAWAQSLPQEPVRRDLVVIPPAEGLCGKRSL